MSFNQFKFQKGFAAFYVAILVMTVVFGLATSIFVLTSGQQKISKNAISSAQAYYGAESGLEDALLRLTKDMDWASPYTLDVAGESTNITISEIIGGSRTITAQGQVANCFRKTAALYEISTEEVSFHYGAQAGDGGMLMGSNARVAGNVFSNGSVIASSGNGYINDTIIVAQNGNRIEGLIVGRDAKAHTCKDSSIDGTLTYVSGGSVEDCDAGEAVNQQPNEIEPKNLPISQTQIDGWKNDAQNGGTISGDYTLGGGDEENLGPQKISGNMLIDNGATLNMTGTIWVVGNLRIDNGATIKLDSASYGSRSGTIVVDGKIKVRPNTHLRGSGQEGSHLLLLSTNPEVLDANNPAIDVDNNTDAAIFYTTQGLIVLRNNVQAREVTGYKVYLDNNAEILYEAGLEEAYFTSGPGGCWDVTSWQEVE